MWGKAAFGTPLLALSTWDFVSMVPMRFAGFFCRYLKCRSVFKRADLENVSVCSGAPHTQISLKAENNVGFFCFIGFFFFLEQAQCDLCHEVVVMIPCNLLAWVPAWNQGCKHRISVLVLFSTWLIPFIPALEKSHCLCIKHIADFFELHLFTFSKSFLIRLFTKFVFSRNSMALTLINDISAYDISHLN